MNLLIYHFMWPSASLRSIVSNSAWTKSSRRRQTSKLVSPRTFLFFFLSAVFFVMSFLLGGDDGVYSPYTKALTASTAMKAPYKYSTKTDPDIQKMIDWVFSKGGYVNEKVQIRRDPSNSYYGMFAIDNIPLNEILLEIPHDCVLALDGDTLTDRYYEDLCSLTYKLIEEIDLGQKSEYAPFINYVKNQPYGQLPATYTPAGKELLRKVIGRSLLPPESGISWMKKHFHGSCIEKGDAFQEQAVALVVQRGWDTALLPIYDMVNHHNGLVNTECTSVYDPNGFKVRTTKEILSGQEIYNTYNKCLDCGDVADYWGTPEIYRDFGFVENYPQRWFFHKPKISFEISQVHWKGVMSYEIEWLDEVPDHDEIAFLKEQYERLEYVYRDDIQPAISKEGDVIPEYEFSMIVQYHSALKTAISAAIQVAEHTPPLSGAPIAREKEVWG